MWFALSFVVLSVASHELLGECFLTRIARDLRVHSGGHRGEEPFTVLLVNAVAGVRPTTREAVLAWEIAVFATSAASLWCWRGTRGTAPREISHAVQRQELERTGTHD
jgi:hypothetical protein